MEYFLLFNNIQHIFLNDNISDRNIFFWKHSLLSPPLTKWFSVGDWSLVIHAWAVCSLIGLHHVSLQNQLIIIKPKLQWHEFTYNSPCAGTNVCSWCDGSLHRSFMEWTHWAISRSSQCSTTGITKAVVRPILSVGWCI